MTITELKNKGLIPTILSELYDDNSIKHWWIIADRRKDSERLYIGCKYPASSRKSFDTFEDCVMNLKEIINSFNMGKPLNKQFDDFLNDNI